MAENDGKTEEYEVEGVGTVMLNTADAEAYGDRAKKVSKQAPDPTTAQREAEEAERKRIAGEEAAAAAAAKVREDAANKAAKTPANKSA